VTSDLFSIKSVVLKDDCILLFTSGELISEDIAPIYYCESNGIYVALFNTADISHLNLNTNDTKEVISSINCTAICITGENFKKHPAELGLYLSKILNFISPLQIYQILFQFSENSVVFVIENTDNIDAILIQIHNLILNSWL